MLALQQTTERCLYVYCKFTLLFQLAADANNMVAMTEEEKKRLEEILSDMGDLMEEVGLSNRRFFTFDINLNEFYFLKHPAILTFILASQQRIPDCIWKRFCSKSRRGKTTG